MSLDLRRRAELSTEQVAALAQALAGFYNNPPANYYPIANQSANRYTPVEKPFHCDLAGRVFPGATVLEVGCGTAHLCPPVEKNGGTYTGLDHSEALLADNARRFPKARFFQIGAPPAETFDIVASLYTLEHIADPPAYLDSLWRYCRPGGWVGIICPEFIDGPGLPPSVFFGTTPRRFREKLQTFRFGDAIQHWLDWKWRAPLWKSRAQAEKAGAFWINLQPKILHDAAYGIDTDAVHLTRLQDLVWFFEQKGAEVIQTSKTMPDISPDVLRHNCYLLVRKPKS
jgi:SAM-dependent methyltransferase